MTNRSNCHSFADAQMPARTDWRRCFENVRAVLIHNTDVIGDECCDVMGSLMKQYIRDSNGSGFRNFMKVSETV